MYNRYPDSLNKYDLFFGYSFISFPTIWKVPNKLEVLVAAEVVSVALEEGK